MDDLYRTEIIDHYKNPRNFGELKRPFIKVRETNVSCGDVIEMTIKLRKGKILDMKFKGTGCALSIAAASMLTERLKGKRLEEAIHFRDKDMYDVLGMKPLPARMRCVLLPLRALQKFLARFN